MAKFVTLKKIRLRSRPGVFLVGEVVEGVVRSGMLAKIWIDGGAFSYEKIESVEYVDNLDGQSWVAIQLRLEHPDDADVVRHLCPDGSEIEIVDA